MVESSRARGPQAGYQAAPAHPLVIAGAWGLLIGAIQLYAWRAMLTPAEVAQQLMVVCRSSPLGALIFIGVASLSPLMLLPAALLGSLAGACFGPAYGILYTLIGCNLSALLMYGLGRCSRQQHGRITQLCARYGPQIQRRPMLSVIVLRLSFLPYDPVNFLVGLLHVRPWPFLLGNTLGSLPGVVAIVLAGSAVSGLGVRMAPVSPAHILGASVLLAASVALVVALRRRPSRRA